MLLARAEVFRACDCYPIAVPLQTPLRVVAQSLKPVKLLAMANGPSNSQRCWANNAGSCCVRLLVALGTSFNIPEANCTAEFLQIMSFIHEYKNIADVENHIIRIRQLQQDCKEMRSAWFLKIYVFAYCT